MLTLFKRLLKVLFVCLVLATVTLTMAWFELNPSPADHQIWYNAHVITMDENKTTAQAIEVKDGVIVAVGSNPEILAKRSDETLSVDAKG